jgi:anaerobic selenocysteine-containing dehydrogenase
VGHAIIKPGTKGKNMSKNISRRDFLKLAGAGTAVTAVLTGCGPESRYVVREPYVKMPEYTYNGQSTYYATTCRECAAGCGLVVRTMQGRAIKVEGNMLHPVNKGKTCSRGQATLQGLYNPDRMQNPVKQKERGSKDFSEVTWDEAVATVTTVLKDNKPDEIAFLLGLAPDHLFDLVSQLTSAIGAPAPQNYGALGMFEARATLSDAAKSMFGSPSLLFFDMGKSDLTFSFGANFTETWLSPVAYTRGYSLLRQGTPGRRGYLVQFEPRLSQTAMNADEWIPVVPGTEGLVALALGRLVAALRGGALPAAFSAVDVDAVAKASGVERAELERLATMFANAAHPLAIPGGEPLGQSNGFESAQAILALNALVGNLGSEGGVFITPSTNVNETEYHKPATVKELADLVKKMAAGGVKVLFIHGVNPLFELPPSLGFSEALKSVPLVISFSSTPDETAVQSDFIFPDHTYLESYGYQRIWTGADRETISGGQPAVAPYYNTRATSDVILAAVGQTGGKASEALPYKDEVEFIQNQLLGLVSADGGIYQTGDINNFWAMWQQFGGWWKNDPGLDSPQVPGLDSVINIKTPEYEGDGEFHLLAYPSPILGDGAGANYPWLQETGDPATTVVWNSWVEINPKTAEELGLNNDDVVLITSPAGAIEASVYQYPAIRPDTIAVPFGQGHTALGRYAENRGVNPSQLFGLKFNQSGDLAFAAMKVTIKKTGRQRPLARLESVMGVYGDGPKK